jgi:hypothetical protein
VQVGQRVPTLEGRRTSSFRSEKTRKVAAWSCGGGGKTIDLPKFACETKEILAWANGELPCPAARSSLVRPTRLTHHTSHITHRHGAPGRSRHDRRGASCSSRRVRARADATDSRRLAVPQCGRRAKNVAGAAGAKQKKPTGGAAQMQPDCANADGAPCCLKVPKAPNAKVTEPCGCTTASAWAWRWTDEETTGPCRPGGRSQMLAANIS